MTDNQIIAEVKRYLSDQTYNYALLIDGEWGCGKTFFANHKLRIAIDEHEKAEETNRIIKYVSLYGCKTIQDIYERIALSYVKDIFEKKGKEYPEKVSSVMIMAFKGLKEKFAPEFDLFDALKEFTSSNENIFIIDDLERCDCSINEVFGYINTLVEHDGAKVILIANESEISLSKNYDSNALQLMVAANPLIDVNYAANNSNMQNNLKKVTTEGKIFTNAELEQRRKKIFPSREDAAYKRIREKVIGVSLHYNPNTKEVCSEIIRTTVTNEELKTVLLELLDYFCEKMESFQHNNLRTFQFYLSKITYLIKRIQDIQLTDKEKEYRKKAIISVAKESFLLSVKFKSNYQPNLWNDLGKSDMLYSSIDIYLKTGTFDINSFTKDIKNYIELYYIQKIQPDDPANLLRNCYFCNSEKWCLDRIEEIKNNLLQNKYPRFFYQEIVVTIQLLISLGFEEQLMDDIKRIMLDNIMSENNANIIDDDLFYIIEDSSVKTKSKLVIQELNEAITKCASDNRTQSVLDILNNEEWALELEAYIKDCFKTDSTWSLFSMASKEKWIELIFNASAENLSTFRRVFQKIYNRKTILVPVSNEDIDLMKDLFEECDKHEQSDIIIKKNIEWLKRQLKEAIELHTM